MPSALIEVYPPAEVLPYEYFAESPELTAQRLKVMSDLVRGKRIVIVAPLAALTRRLPPREAFAQRGLKVKSGMVIDREELLARLVELGYQRVERVEARAEFAARGDIVDVFPLPAARPYRIELFDNEVDSIREFDPDSQRSRTNIKEIWLEPAMEANLSPAQREKALARLKEAATLYQQHLISRGLSAQAEKVQFRVDAL